MLRGMGVTIKHLFNTFVDDLSFLGQRYYSEDSLNVRQGTRGRGVFTVQYPEEKLPVPERFRFIPFLLYEENEDGSTTDRCTSCGICAKVCPPQCIWIERSSDPETGRPIPEPTRFFIDIDICMNCAPALILLVSFSGIQPDSGSWGITLPPIKNFENVLTC